MTAAVPLTILLVDDAEDCVATLEVALQSLPGVLVRSVRTAEEGLALLAGQHVDAVITDIHLPSMNGLEFIASIRRDPASHALPILVVSADPDPLGPRLAMESGADGYFSKSFSPGAVRKKLEELMYAR
jgi:two-component system phosphate regulon response regulator PhoB